MFESLSYKHSNTISLKLTMDRKRLTRTRVVYSPRFLLRAFVCELELFTICTENRKFSLISSLMIKPVPICSISVPFIEHSPNVTN